MITIRILKQLILIALATATINFHNETTLSWYQTRNAYLCLYNESTLLFCKDFTAGNNTVILGSKGPLVSHVVAGAAVHILEIGRTTLTVVGVVRPAILLPIFSR